MQLMQRKNFSEILYLVSQDPVLLGKLPAPILLTVVDPSKKTVDAYHFGNNQGALTAVRLQCLDIPSLESSLNGENADLLTIWSSQKMTIEGDTAACILIVDALFRYAKSGA